jgi:hypothetical protein
MTGFQPQLPIFYESLAATTDLAVLLSELWALPFGLEAELESFDPERWWSRRFRDNVYPESGEEDSGE